MRLRPISIGICLAFFFSSPISAQPAPKLSRHGRKIQQELSSSSIGDTITVIASPTYSVCGKLTVKDPSSFEVAQQPDGAPMSFWYDDVSKITSGCSTNQSNSHGKHVAKVIVTFIVGTAAVTGILLFVMTRGG